MDRCDRPRADREGRRRNKLGSDTSQINSSTFVGKVTSRTPMPHYNPSLDGVKGPDKHRRNRGNAKMHGNEVESQTVGSARSKTLLRVWIHWSEQERVGQPLVLLFGCCAKLVPVFLKVDLQLKGVGKWHEAASSYRTCSAHGNVGFETACQPQVAGCTSY